MEFCPLPPNNCKVRRVVEMKAIEISKPGVVCIAEREKPTPNRGEVLLKVNRVGYCGSDLGAFKGLNPLVTYPRVPGHEIGATIVELGADVQGWTIGQEVLVIPYSSCGECSACQKERFNCCMNNETLGVQREGMLCEYATAPVEKLIASEKLSLQELALVEPLTVGFHAVARGQVSESDTVAVIGCGRIAGHNCRAIFKTNGLNIAFVVKYDMEGQIKLSRHHDASAYSLTITLNTPDIDFKGGGTNYVKQNTVVRGKKGYAVLHPGRLTHYHEGLPITEGTRYIMVSFVN